MIPRVREREPGHCVHDIRSYPMSNFVVATQAIDSEAIPLNCNFYWLEAVIY